MIPVFVDNRSGSDELADPLTKLGFQVELTTLAYGDVAFVGKGPDHATVQVGIEFKKLPDLVQSLQDGRLSGHQIPGLLKSYDYRWLLLEGEYQTNKTGHVAVPRWSRRSHKQEWYPLQPTTLSSSMEKRVLSFEVLGGVHVRYTNTRRDSLVYLSNLIHWFTDKAMDEHTSHLHDHQPLGFLTISDFRSVVQRFPGISLGTSLAVEQHFQANLRRAVSAKVDEWAGITTMDRKGQARRLGIKKAERIVAFCEGR